MCMIVFFFFLSKIDFIPLLSNVFFNNIYVSFGIDRVSYTRLSNFWLWNKRELNYMEISWETVPVCKYIVHNSTIFYL